MEAHYLVVNDIYQDPRGELGVSFPVSPEGLEAALWQAEHDCGRELLLLLEGPATQSYAGGLCKRSEVWEVQADGERALVRRFTHALFPNGTPTRERLSPLAG
jgi:hypothetical protein